MKTLKFRMKDSDSWARIDPLDDLEVRVEIDFNNIIGKQKFSRRINEDIYRKEIAWARTFVRSPLDGDEGRWERIRKIFPSLPKDQGSSPIIVFNQKEFITKLKASDEPVRHKMLDFLGDISLLGTGLEGSVEIFKPGHYFNQQLVLFLSTQL